MQKNYKFSGYTNAIILMKFSSGTKGIINASNNAIGVNEHIINFSNDKGSVILKGKDQYWITGFKVYLTDNQKLTQKKILLKKKKLIKILIQEFIQFQKLLID